MVYLGDGSHQCGWGEVLPSPGSEPPPPYSPPRTHNRQFFPAAFSNPNYYHTHNYYDLTPDSSPPDSLTSQETTPIKDAPPPYPPMSSLKAAHAAALNHSDSSAFSPPKSKCNFNSPPPPAYTLTYNPHLNNNNLHPSNSVSHQNSVSHPNISVSHPNNTAPHPKSSVPHPNSSVPHPNSSVPHPNSCATHPNSSASHPNSSASHPNSMAPHPNSSAPHSNSSAPHPNSSAPHPNSSASLPNNNVRKPNINALQPNKSHLHSNNNAPLLKKSNVQQPKPGNRQVTSQPQPGTSKPTNQVQNHSKGVPIPKVASNNKGSVPSKSIAAQQTQGRDVVTTEPRGRGSYRPQEPSKPNIAKIQEKSRSLDRDSRPRLLSHPPVLQQDQPRVPYIGTMGPVGSHMSSGPHSLMGEGYVDHRNPHRGRDIHPGQGPLLRTGKSLELPRSRAPTNHHQHQHPMPTAHTHPHHHNPITSSSTHTKENRNFSTSKSSSSSSLMSQQHQVTKEPRQGSTALSKSSKLAYVGIAPAKPVRLHERTNHQRERGEKHQRPNQVGGRVASRSEERWLSKASHLEQQAAKACTAVRAVPVNTGTPQRRTANPYRIDLEVHSPPGRPYNPILDDPFGTRSRLRSCRSLDELSDLLDDESPNSRLLPSATRSLDDLTDPIYENVDVIHAHTRRSPRHAHNSSVDNLLDPPRPPRQRNNSLSSLLDDLANAGRANSLARKGHNISVPDVLESDRYNLGSPTSTLRSFSSVTTSKDDTQDISVQLKKIQEVAKILGVKYRNGELSSGSGSESCSTDTSPRGHSKLEELQHHSLDYLTSNHYPQQQTPAPVPPARAPVIHDISGILKEKQDLQKPYSNLSTQGTDADATSQESGYGSVDSRTFRQHPSPEQHIKQHISMHMQSHHQSLEYQINNNVRSTQPRQLQVHKPSQHQYQQQQKYQRQEQYREPKLSLQASQHQQQYRHQKQAQPYQSQTTTTTNSTSSNSSNKSSQHPSLSPPRQYTAVELQMDWISPHQQQTLQKLLQGYYPIQWLKQGVNQDKLGIYIKSVVPGGAADADGRLQAGDQLLSVDGKSLLGITQEQAAAYMMETGPVVTLEVARQGAIFHGLATLLSQPSPQVNRGYPAGGRHMSERDLPSKVLRDPHHPDQTPSHPHHPHQQGPRMQAAKSVPSLNSEGERVGKAGHDVFNPAYSRTSSNQSLAQNSGQHPHHPGQQHPHHHQHNHLQQRSRSTQNLSESRSVGEEERHYQNISFHQGSQDPRMASMRGRPQNAPPPLGSPASQGSDGPIHRPPEHLRPASAFLQREDVGRPGDLQRPASQRDLRADAKMAEMQEEVRRREDRFRHNNGPISPVQMQQQRGGTLPQQQQRGPGGYPTSPYGGPPQEGFSPQQHQYPPGYQGQQGQQVTSPHGQAQHQPMFGHGPQQTAGTHPGYSGKHGPPPTAPKPRPGSTNAAPNEAPEKPLRHYGQDGIPGDGGPPRPPPPEDGYRESPPPPPPPTSTHPLFQTNNRPASSSGFANTPNAPGKGNFSKSSPWDREEKEKYEVRRREGVRQWRDELITGLENLEIRTPEQNERLGTLRLERDFQQRAEATIRNKGDNEDDDDDDEDDDEDEDNEDNHDYRDQSTLEYNRTNLEQPKVNGGGPVDERSRKEDEIRRKQQELEAASEAEERLLREAQRRQEEEMRRYQQQQQLQHQQHLQQQQQLHHHQQQQQQLHHHQQQSGYQHQHQASQRLDSLVLSSPGSGGQQSSYSNGPVNGSVRSPQGPYSSSETVMKVDPGQPSPQPPERGSSYNIMQQSGSNRNYKSPESSAPVKRVQFSEATNADPLSHITFDTNANHEKAPREDPDHFLNEAENMLNSSPTRTTGGTPGVIGAQEIYRDPRWRRMQEQQAQQAAAKAPVPEKLTFKEKMKMFAMETGDQDSPKDRVKNSRAERDIQHGAPQQ